MDSKKSENQEGQTDVESDGWNVFYEPSPQYRNVFADGMIVTPSDDDMVSITFYNERIAIPKQVRMEPDHESKTISENFVSGKRGSIRYLEDTVFLSKSSALELIKWLEKVTKFLDDDSQESIEAGDE